MFRIHPKIQHDLDEGSTPFQGNPSIPDATTPKELALDEYNRLVERFKRLDIPENLPEMHLARMFMELETGIRGLEQPLQQKIFELAEKMVREALLVSADDLNFKFEDFNFQLPDFNLDFNQQPPPNRNAPVDANLRELVHKRRIVNSMIQGAAHHVQDLFYSYEQEVAELSPELAAKYPLLMAMADSAYWTMPPHPPGFNVTGGLMQLDFSTQPMSVKVQGGCLPLLLHELGKGVMEALSLHSLPRDAATRKAVLAAADRPDTEDWDLRVGPAIWRKFLSVFEADEVHVRNETYRRFVALPVAEFKTAAKELLAAHGKDAIKSTWIFSIKQELLNEE